MLNLDVEDLSDKKLLLIDDEQDILDLLELVLRREGFSQIFKAGTGSEGLDLCKQVNPDMVVLDIMLPDIDGFKVCKKMREFSLCPIIFLSAKSDDFDKLLGLGIGGDDYMTKPFSPKEVAFKIKAYFRRARYLKSSSSTTVTTEEIIKFGDLALDLKKAELRKQGQVLNLTAKEYQLLVYMIKNKGNILSKSLLLETIWGSDFEGYENTLMVHIRNLRSKIEEDPSSPKYIVTARGLGYKFIMEA